MEEEELATVAPAGVYGPPAPPPMMESEHVPPPEEAIDNLLNQQGDPQAAAVAFNHYAEEPDPGSLGATTPVVDRVAALGGDEQAAAIRDMDDEQFDQLVAEIPAGDTAALEQLVQNCDDPARKLELWRNAQTTQNQRELDTLSPESEESSAQAERARRSAILDTTEVEVEEEVSRLQASGQPMTLEQVDDMIRRKQLEHEIEMAHNVNLTNESGERADGSRITWSEEELAVMQGTLAQAPDALLSDPNVVREFRREDKNAHGDNAQNDPNGNIISIYDSGARTTPGSAREAADPSVSAMLGDNTTWMEHVVLHELGHSAERQMPDSRAVYDQAASMHDPAAQPGEYFAQDYKNALINPQTHARNALDVPMQELNAARAAVHANPSDPAAIAAHEAAMRKADSYERMYSEMRNEVFDADGTERQYTERMQGEGMSEEEIAEFQERAARLSTPEQIDRLAEEYNLPE
jgi:hypothetical protein